MDNFSDVLDSNLSNCTIFPDSPVNTYIRSKIGSEVELEMDVSMQILFEVHHKICEGMAEKEEMEG